MGKITIDLILKVVEAIASIACVISDTIKGRNKEDDSTGSVKKK